MAAEGDVWKETLDDLMLLCQIEWFVCEFRIY
jgi:hypothetical protein